MSLREILLSVTMEKLSDVCEWRMVNRKMLFAWGSGCIMSKMTKNCCGNTERDIFTHPEICDYVALHHKVSTESDFFLRNWKGSELTIFSAATAVWWWMASHFIEFFASLILLLRCTSLLLNWIDFFYVFCVHFSPLFPALAHSSPPHVCTIYLKYDNIFMFLPWLRIAARWMNQVLFEIVPRGFSEWFWSRL
jgi:hypothetical protein